MKTFITVVFILYLLGIGRLLNTINNATYPRIKEPRTKKEDVMELFLIIIFATWAGLLLWGVL